jgi:hypothetical protein
MVAVKELGGAALGGTNEWNKGLHKGSDERRCERGLYIGSGRGSGGGRGGTSADGY